MSHHGLIKVLGAFSLVALCATPTLAETRRAKLDGYHEVAAISTPGTGTFKATISNDETMIAFELTYGSLEGTTVTQAHIHFAQEGVNGAVVVFLCGGGGKPACPVSAPPGTPVTGTIVAANVIAAASQGIAAMELAELITAIRSKAAYVNVHTDLRASGEIRGQVK